MLKTISLKKFISIPKFKTKNTNNVYDENWNMYFSNEEKRQQFLNRIAKAEKNIKEGNVYSQEEVEIYFKEKYGIIENL